MNRPSRAELLGALVAGRCPTLEMRGAFGAAGNRETGFREQVRSEMEFGKAEQSALLCAFETLEKT
jgi:hypothetical protein